MVTALRGPATTALLSLIALAAAGEGPEASRVLIAGGGYHSLALDPQGKLWAWGANLNGQLGEGTRFDRHIPFESKLPQGVRPLGIAAGEDHSLVVDAEGHVFALGKNDSGQLGDGTTDDRAMAVRVEGVGDVVQVAAGARHSLALDRSGRVWAWGDNEHGQLGDGSRRTRRRPVRLTGVRDVTAIAAGARHSLALLESGDVCAWGDNAEGQLGDAATRRRQGPRRVQGLPKVASVSAGGGQTLVLSESGQVWAFGDNTRGQLGLPTSDLVRQPVRVPGLEGIRELAVGAEHVLALDAAGQVWSFGDNTLGQLCRDRLGASLPQAVVTDAEHLGSTPVIAVAAGFYHSLLLTADHRIWAGGFNYSGQLGDWTYTNQERPSPLWRQCCSAERR